MEIVKDYPVGRLKLIIEDGALVALTPVTDSTPLISAPDPSGALKWLDIYFSGRQPDFLPKLHFIGTPFRKRVWEELLKIPYGETVSYGFVAKKIGIRCARAVGGAVGHNPIPIIVPCHRVIASDGSIGGFSLGIYLKLKLLKTEGIEI